MSAKAETCAKSHQAAVWDIGNETLSLQTIKYFGNYLKVIFVEDVAVRWDVTGRTFAEVHAKVFTGVSDTSKPLSVLDPLHPEKNLSPSLSVFQNGDPASKPDVPV